MTPDTGFVGFNRDNILIVANSVTEEEALELGIRDGCASGTVLIVNGNAVKIDYSGYSPRTAIGQRADCPPSGWSNRKIPEHSVSKGARRSARNKISVPRPSLGERP